MLGTWVEHRYAGFGPEAARRLGVLADCGAGILVLTLAAIGLLVWAWRTRRPLRRVVWWSAILALAPAAATCVSFAYAALIEPRWLDVTHATVTTDRLPAGTHLRIALLSDFHVDGWSHLLRGLPVAVNAENPDLIVYAGDSLNRKDALPVFRELLSRMHARYGIYGVRGNHDFEFGPSLDLFGGGLATELDGTPLTVADGLVTLCGARWTRPDRLISCLEHAGSGLAVAVFHTPDLIDRASSVGTDLYLAGHTHGGQVRLPGYGALVTMSAFDKRYEAGEYQVDETTLFVTRGIGLEGHMVPVRFLCRPEVTIIDLDGTGERLSGQPTVRRMKDGDRIILPSAPQ